MGRECGRGFAQLMAADPDDGRRGCRIRTTDGGWLGRREPWLVDSPILSRRACAGGRRWRMPGRSDEGMAGGFAQLTGAAREATAAWAGVGGFAQLTVGGRGDGGVGEAVGFGWYHWRPARTGQHIIGCRMCVGYNGLDTNHSFCYHVLIVSADNRFCPEGVQNDGTTQYGDGVIRSFTLPASPFSFP